MSQEHHDDAHHSSGGGMEWLITNMGGIITPVGQGMEKFFEWIMMPMVNGFFQRAAVVYMFVFTPVLILELLFHVIRS